jgi:6-phosphogluconolactonase
MTFPILNQARQVLFLVSGEKKANVLQEILEGEPAVTKYPAAGIRPSAGKAGWLIDQGAAKLLKRSP